MSSNILKADNGVSSGTTGLVYTAGNDGTLQLATTTSGGTATTAITIDNSQNVGVGVTPSAWGGFKALQIGAGGALANPNSLTRVDLTANAYYNGSQDTYIGTGAATSYRLNGGQHIWYYAPSGTAGGAIAYTEAMRIDTNGNLGLGVAPSAWASGYTSLQIGQKGNSITSYGAGSNVLITSNCYYNVNWNYGLGTSTAASSYTQAGGVHQWSVAPAGTGTFTPTLAMTLDNSGNFLLGTTSIGTLTGNSFFAAPVSGGANIGITHSSGTSSGQVYAQFFYNGTTIGSITQSGTTAVLYNTTSDYRLKSNVQPVTSGLSVINQLNPVNFTWISDNEADTGFLAHEFQAVIPRSVTGEKDATKTEEYEITPAVKDEDGNVTTPAVMGTRTVPVYQQMDNSGAVPYLVAAIKELSAEVTALKAKIGV